jgi:hypothetical protein
MRFMFVYWKLENAGSAQTILNYAAAARELGHEVVLYADPDDSSKFACSLDIDSADAVVFLLEWNIYLHENKPLDLSGALRWSAREQRIAIDNDGMYNDPIRVDGDYNHPTIEDSRKRTELYDSISDRIYQPTLHPLRPNVKTFLFHGYNPAWEAPLDPTDKPYGMLYVGSNWFRWRAMSRVLRAIEPVRHRVGRVRIVGHDWTEMPWWVESPLREDAYFVDTAYLRALNVEVCPPVPIGEVVATMGQGVFNPVLVRPTFNHLRLVNPRLFETLAANTIPLFALDEAYVKEIYGQAGAELVLDEDPSRLIVDVLERPHHYAAVVTELRRHLAERHSFIARVTELIDLVRN